jgi:hypothetical protein
MLGIGPRFVLGTASVALGVVFMMLSADGAFACHAVGIPSIVGPPDSPQCQAALAARSAPEVGGSGALAALAVVGALAALLYERRRKR